MQCSNMCLSCGSLFSWMLMLACEHQPITTYIQPGKLRFRDNCVWLWFGSKQWAGNQITGFPSSGNDYRGQKCVVNFSSPPCVWGYYYREWYDHHIAMPIIIMIILMPSITLQITNSMPFLYLTLYVLFSTIKASWSAWNEWPCPTVFNFPFMVFLSNTWIIFIKFHFFHSCYIHICCKI